MLQYPSDARGTQRGPAALNHALKSGHIPILDGLRAVAVFFVVFYHLGYERSPGGYGVIMFFVISGFLITWLLLKEHDRTHTIDLRQFYRRRTLRIFPAFYVYALVVIGALLMTKRPVLWTQAVASLFYLTDYYNAILGDPNTAFSHTWSLAIEEQFYLVWPIFFLFLLRHRCNMARVLSVAIACIWIYRAFLCYVVGVNQGYIYAAFDTRCDALIVGCLLAVLLKEDRFPNVIIRFVSHPIGPILTLLLLVVVIYLPELVGKEIPRYRDVFGFLLAPPLIALAIIQLIAHHAALPWRWMETTPVKFLGKISYSLYLYQQIVLGPVEHSLRALPRAVVVVACVFVTIAVASTSYYFVERPLMRWKRKPTLEVAPL